MASDPQQPPIRFSVDDMTLFSRASRDVSPLHLAAEFARRTAYGQPVVFGILAVVAGLGRLRPRPNMMQKNLVVDFPSPMFMGVDYRIVVVDDGDEKAAFKLYDGQRVLCRVTVRFQPNSSSIVLSKPSDTNQPRYRDASQDWSDDALTTGLTIENDYAPDPSTLAQLEDRYALKNKGTSPFQLGVLLWSSYLIGMELPGRRAIFSRLTLDFGKAQAAESHAFRYAAGVQSLDERYALLHLQAELSVAGVAVAKGTLQSFVNRPARDDLNRRLLLGARVEPRLTGKVALIIGASRGLGGALAQALVLAGCATYATYFKGKEDAQRLREELPESLRHRFHIIHCDGSIPEDCHSVRSLIEHEHGTLDILVCNASPPLLPLWLEESAIERLGGYMQKAIALFNVPLATFLAIVTPKTGWAVAISSIAVENPIAQWPHYVAAKMAIEGLMDVAAREYPRIRFLVARPSRLLTDLTNTPLGRQEALPPEEAALRLLERMETEAIAGRVHILREFGPGEQTS